MQTTCLKCRKRYDDADRLTYCPHDLIMPRADLEQKKLALALHGKDIVFAHLPDEPARRIQSISWNGMVTVTGMPGEFAPHIFRVKGERKLRTITDHIVEGDSANHQVTIAVTDEPGAGGANHAYSIRWKNERDQTEPHAFIGFQNGPIKENGVNGVTQEALLAIVVDRLRSFQKGPFSCRENAIALTHCEDALMWLQRRTRVRIARGVEGTTTA